MRSFFRVAFVCSLALGCFLPEAGAQYAGTAELKQQAVVNGKVLGPDGKPLSGVRVLAYHVSSELVYASQPTNRKGEYVIGSLKFGYYDLAVETSEGLWPGNQMVNIPPASKSTIVVTLAPDPPSAVKPPRPFPGHDTPSLGSVDVVEKSRGREFWRSKRGVAILAGGASVVLLILAGQSNESTATPVIP